MAKGNIVKRDVVNIENWLFVIYAALIFIYQFINLLRAATTTTKQQARDAISDNKDIFSNRPAASRNRRARFVEEEKVEGKVGRYNAPQSFITDTASVCRKNQFKVN